MEQRVSSNLDSDLALYESVSGETYFEEDSRAQQVLISKIHFDELYQARSGVYHKQATAYANAMKNGHKFQPVRLAKVDGKISLVVIDGWHRLYAVASLGAETVPAIVECMTSRDAMYYASIANLGHGLQLKKAELRNAFKLFMKSGRYRKNGKQLMSYREISTALYGCVGHTTIANWMKKDFPKIARAMGGIEHGNAQAELPRVDVQRHYKSQAYSGLEQALINFKELTCPMDKHELYEITTKLVAEMGQHQMVRPEF